MKTLVIIILLLNFHNIWGQSVNYPIQHISEETYCINLNPNELINSEDHWRIFGESNIDTTSNVNIFRFITMGLSSTEVISFELKDSTCAVTIKVIKNIKKNQGLVHSKIYKQSVWKDFMNLTDTTFWKLPEHIEAVGAIHDGEFKIYEFKLGDKYHKIVRSSNTGDTQEIATRKYLGKLIGSFYEVNCKNNSR